jgi:hypothetical protein
VAATFALSTMRDANSALGGLISAPLVAATFPFRSTWLQMRLFAPCEKQTSPLTVPLVHPPAATFSTHVLSRKCYCSHSNVFSLIFPYVNSEKT